MPEYLETPPDIVDCLPEYAPPQVEAPPEFVDYLPEAAPPLAYVPPVECVPTIDIL